MTVKPGVQGLEEAANVARAVEVLGAIEGNATFFHDVRTPYEGRSADQTPSNAQIIDFLAEGNSRSASPTKRDIRPESAEVDKLSVQFLEGITKGLRALGRRQTRKTKAGKRRALLNREQVDKKIKAIFVRELKKTGKGYAELMFNNAAFGYSKYDPVTEKYAQWRVKRFGVSKNARFVASRQLLTALQEGRVKVEIKEKGIKKALKIINQ
jgi:hypothetical protein